MDNLMVQQELERLEKYFFDKANWEPVLLTRVWAKSLPNTSGVYMLFDSDKLVYVGETGKISARAMDMLNSRHHTVRRSIGEKLYSHLDDYAKATSSIKYPVSIETLVQKKMLALKLCCAPINFGRKEFEEYITEKYGPIFNRSTKRK